MNQDVLEFVKALGVGCRHPNDEFFQQGNELNKINKIFGVHEVDDEENYHKSYPEFACHIPGCSVTCETTFEYDQHYNSCHRYSCSQCKKYLPSFHLLNLHIMETHDAYFLASSDKKPMFQCYLQECKMLFQTPQQRKDHCIKDHKFPANFRFGVANKWHPKKKHKKRKDEETDENCMEIEISTEETSDSRKERKPSSKANAPKKSLGVRRKPVLDMKCFVKDMRESLPVVNADIHHAIMLNAEHVRDLHFLPPWPTLMVSTPGQNKYSFLRVLMIFTVLPSFISGPALHIRYVLNMDITRRVIHFNDISGEFLNNNNKKCFQETSRLIYKNKINKFSFFGLLREYYNTLQKLREGQKLLT